MNLEDIQILLTNDDGIFAPGLKVLKQIADTLSDDVWTVAPDTEQSGASHSLTLKQPIRLHDMKPKKYCVSGTPTDCVLLALNQVLPKEKSTLVLSGINRGCNLGEDVTYSGTIAAAMEGTLLGAKSIAISLEYEKHDEMYWDTVYEFAPDIIRKLVKLDWPENVLMNINFPAVPASEVTGVHLVRHGKRAVTDKFIERIDPRGKPYYWIGMYDTDIDTGPDTDIGVIAQKGISITPLCLDLTAKAFMEKLEGIFK